MRNGIPSIAFAVSGKNMIQTFSLFARRLVPLACVLLFTGCSEVTHRLDPEVTQKLFDFLHDGTTERQEVLDRLGAPDDVYEDGRILIYQPFRNDDRQNINQIPMSDNYRNGMLVLVFRNDGKLENHSFVVLK